MKFLSKIDTISPSITLYYKGELAHPSIFSSILSLVCYILIFIFIAYYLREFFQKKNPSAYFFNRYVEDAGNFSLNSHSIFNFLQISRNENVIDIDFDSVRFIGFDVAISSYSAYNILTNYDHWIYGKCNNNTDTEGIGYLINSNDYFKSACIRKYYNKTLGKYYDTNDINFRWPSLNRGCSNPNATYYGIVVEKCRNDSLRTNLEKKYCKSGSEIDKYMLYTGLTLKIIDHVIDVFNYDEPFTKYFEDISNAVYSDTYIVNHLNLNPVNIETRKGLIFERVEEKRIHLFDKNEKVTASTGSTGIYMAYYFWMQNSLHYYERKYQLLQDVLSNIGGITRIILFVANLINRFASYYVTLEDSEELFIDQNSKYFMEEINNKIITEKKIKKDIDSSNLPIRKMCHNNYLYQNNNAFFDNNYMSKENYNHSKSSKEDIANKTDNLEKTENKGSNKYLLDTKINNFDEKNNYNNYGKNEPNSVNIIEKINLHNNIKRNILKNDIDNNSKYNKESYNINEIGVKLNKKEINFCKFLYYILYCCRKNNKINYIEKLRYKILSEEMLVQHYLKLKEMNKLLKYIK